MRISNSRAQPARLKQISAAIVSNDPFITYHFYKSTSFGSINVTFHLICVEAPAIASIVRPGQFVTVSCGSEFILRRPLSIHKVDNSNLLYLLFAVTGKGTKWLSQRKKDETLDLLGPLGNGFSISPNSRNLLLIAGGIGIAPIYFLAQQALKQEKSIKLLYGAHTKDGLYPEEYLRGIETVFTTEDGSYGEKGMVTDVITKYTDWADQIYVCGPLAMYKAIDDQKVKWVEEKPTQVLLEVRMACGLGACYGCSIQTTHGIKRVCHDGPVFEFKEVKWQEVRI